MLGLAGTARGTALVADCDTATFFVGLGRSSGSTSSLMSLFAVTGTGRFLGEDNDAVGAENTGVGSLLGWAFDGEVGILLGRPFVGETGVCTRALGGNVKLKGSGTVA